MSISKNGVPIQDLPTWQRVAPPKSGVHWKDGRSAKELARAWLSVTAPHFPDEVEKLLASHSHFGVCKSWHAEPEVRLKFDKFGGETRNTDLLVLGRDDLGTFLLAIEGKADEEFDRLNANVLKNARVRKLNNPRSNGVERLRQLVRAIAGSRSAGTAHVRTLRYQLFTATAGAVCEAERRGIKRAVLLVHEFETSLTEPQRLGDNALDLNVFVSRVSGGFIRTVDAGQIVGPIRLPGAPLFAGTADFYVGKARRTLTSYPMSA